MCNPLGWVTPGLGLVEGPGRSHERVDISGKNSYARSMKSSVTEKGQVTIPKVLRDRMGIAPGQKVVFEERENAILLRPVVPEDPLRRLVGLIREPVDTDAYLIETRGPAWTSSLDGGEE